MRQLSVRIDPGTAPITAGNVALTYVANDGTTQVDNLSAIAAATLAFSQLSSKGVVSFTSAIITGIAGGASPGVQINDTNSLSVPVDPGFVGFSAFKEYDDTTATAVGTVATLAASITPQTTPNATHTFTFGTAYTMPNT